MKIRETGELVGGYNPVCWNMKWRSTDDNYWIETDKSFIFKIDENKIDNSILSRISKPQYAIYHDHQTVNCTFDDIKFHEFTVNFYDLRLCNSYFIKICSFVAEVMFLVWLKILPKSMIIFKLIIFSLKQ